MPNQHTIAKAKAAALEAAAKAADAGGSTEDQVDAARAAAVAAGGTDKHADAALAELAGTPTTSPATPPAGDEALAAAQAAAEAAEQARQEALERARIANEEAEELERAAAERLAAAQAAAAGAPEPGVPTPAAFDPWAVAPNDELADDVTLDEVLATLPDIEPGNDNEEPKGQPPHVLVRRVATATEPAGAPFLVTAKQWRTDLSREGQYVLVEGNPLAGTTREYQAQHATRTAGRRRRAPATTS